MIGLFCFVLAVLASKLRLEAENAVLRHQLIVCVVCIVDPARLDRIIVLAEAHLQGTP